ncbi:uncharacterized protein LOC127160424 [Labeo rohita]|uniref:uncharacterized protein LOC127160424 n=1 Tax=Labeo rohita TaxID=84645 RepID=UPI0021E276CA|nr:uncharacterized protein LOC127160424 [Labeo rohita]
MQHITTAVTINRDPAAKISTMYNKDRRIFAPQLVGYNCAFGVGSDGVSVFVMIGNSFTLHSDVEINQQDRITWYFNDSRIAQITGNQNKICTDVQCNARFRNRLKLDHQTASLTIINTRTTDSGDYKLKITSRSITNIFNVTVHDVPAAQQDEIKRKSVKVGESVTLDPGLMKNPSDLMTWYFVDICIAEITGDKSNICTDDQYKERFKDRLKVDDQTGSLTITNTRNTDSGAYELKINRSRFSIRISFTVTVTAVSDSGLSSAAAVAVPVVLLLVAAAVI